MLQEAVIAIIYNPAKESIVLGLGKPGKKYYSGKWHIPGEKVELGESDELALIRGAREELGLSSIVIIQLLARHVSPTGRNARWYECVSSTEILIPGSDLQEAKWVPKSRIPAEQDQESVLLWPEEIKRFFGLTY